MELINDLLNAGDLTASSDLLSTSQISSSIQKRIKVREAQIAGDDNDDETITKTPVKKATIQQKTIDEMGKREHLETKKQIEQLRKEFGDGWLHSKGATKVQDVMGIQVSPAKPVQTSPQTTEQMLEKLFGMTGAADQQRTSTPIHGDNLATDFAQSSSDVSEMSFFAIKFRFEIKNFVFSNSSHQFHRTLTSKASQTAIRAHKH